jgi:hypothetical protein
MSHRPLRPDFARLAALDASAARGRPADYAQNLRIVNALYAEAVALGVWRRADPLEGVDRKVRLAASLNALRRV